MRKEFQIKTKCASNQTISFRHLCIESSFNNQLRSTCNKSETTTNVGQLVVRIILINLWFDSIIYTTFKRIVYEYKKTHVCEHKKIYVYEYKYIHVYEYKKIYVHEYKKIHVYEYKKIKVYKYTNIHMHDCKKIHSIKTRKYTYEYKKILAC